MRGTLWVTAVVGLMVAGCDGPVSPQNLPPPDLSGKWASLVGNGVRVEITVAKLDDSTYTGTGRAGVFNVPGTWLASNPTTSSILQGRTRVLVSYRIGACTPAAPSCQGLVEASVATLENIRGRHTGYLSVAGVDSTTLRKCPDAGASICW